MCVGTFLFFSSKNSEAGTARSQMSTTLKISARGEPHMDKPFEIECIYQFTFTGDSTSLKLKTVTYFVDSNAFAGSNTFAAIC